MHVKGDPDSVMNKAQKRKQGEGSSNSTCMTLISSFPYSRLTVEQVINLFQVYQIRLGHSLEDSQTIVSSIQHMDRCKFEVVIRQLLGVTRDTQQNATLRLVDLVDPPESDVGRVDISDVESLDS